MSRRRGTSRAPAPAAAPVRRARPRAALLAAAAAALALAAFAAWRLTAPARPAAPDDPLAGMAPRELVARGEELVARRHSRESLPIYRRLIALTAGRNASLHCVHALAIYNSLFEADTLRGYALPVWRTSAERVARMRECVAEFDTAIALAPTPVERARYESRLGGALQAWGFSWEAMEWYRRAAADDPGNATVVRQSRGYLEALGDPLHPRWGNDPAGPGAR